MPLNIVFLRPQKLVSTETLLLKHYNRRQDFQSFIVIATAPKKQKQNKKPVNFLEPISGPDTWPACSHCSLHYVRPTQTRQHIT